MKTTNHRTFIKTMCILLISLTSASIVQAYPPDNAAVLYYKALLMLKEPSEDVKNMMRDLRDGKTRANDQIRQYLHENRHVVEFTETAAEARDCDWGHDFSKGLSMLMPELSKLRMTAFILTAKAQVLAEEGEYRAALSKCLTIHKMARHVSDSTLISYLVSASLGNLANERIGDFLSSMPQDAETLLWLKSRVVAVSVNVPSIRGAMVREKDIVIQEIRREKIDGLLEALDDDFLKDAGNAETVAKVRKGDLNFFKDSREYYANFMDETIAALDLPYSESHRKLKELSARIDKDAKDNPVAIMAALLVPATGRVRTIGTKSGTFFNATRTAIEIYIVKAKTGRLPEKLPADLPKDLFSGEDFEYEKKKDGFVLRCRGKDLDKDETFQYEFKVAK